MAEIGGQEYLAGFILRKFRERHPELVLTGEDCNRLPLSFVQLISRGQLTTPADAMMKLFLKWEERFLAFHNGSKDKWKVNREPNVITFLADRISEDFPHISKDMIKYYVKIRTFVRIGYINKRLEFRRSMIKNATKATQFARSQVHSFEGDEDEYDEQIPDPAVVLQDHCYF